MKEIYIYEAIDGVRFDTKEDAERYEKLLQTIKNAKGLIANQKDYNSAVGLENSIENINSFNKEFREILQEYIPSLVDLWDACPRGIIGRFLSDGSSPIYKIIYNLYYDCVLRVGKRNNKTYGQPYYANGA